MKSIHEYVAESADRQFKQVFGKTIKIGKSLLTTFAKLGMDFRHEYDEFHIYEDGTIEYMNSQLFSGTIKAKVLTTQLNRDAGPNAKISFGDTIESVSDLSSTPHNYIRALLNALMHHKYEVKVADPYYISLTGLDYTKADFEKDKAI